MHDPSCCWQHISCYSNILFICLSWVPFKGLTSTLFLFLLSLLTVSGFVSSRDKNLALSWSALALGATTVMPVFASTLPGRFCTFPGGGLGMLIRVHWCRRGGMLGLGPLISAGVHLSARQVLRQTPRSRRLFKQ